MNDNMTVECENNDKSQNNHFSCYAFLNKILEI